MDESEAPEPIDGLGEVLRRRKEMGWDKETPDEFFARIRTGQAARLAQ